MSHISISGDSMYLSISNESACRSTLHCGVNNIIKPTMAVTRISISFLGIGFFNVNLNGGYVAALAA